MCLAKRKSMFSYRIKAISSVKRLIANIEYFPHEMVLKDFIKRYSCWHTLSPIWMFEGFCWYCQLNKCLLCEMLSQSFVRCKTFLFTFDKELQHIALFASSDFSMQKLCCVWGTFSKFFSTTANGARILRSFWKGWHLTPPTDLHNLKFRTKFLTYLVSGRTFI